MNDRRGEPPSDGELPPDPWAGLAAPSPIPPPTGKAGWDDLASGSSRDTPERARHPSGGWHPSGTTPPGAPSRKSGIWHHPGIWVVLTVLALVALIGAVMDRSAPSGPERSPDSVSAASWIDPQRPSRR